MKLKQDLIEKLRNGEIAVKNDGDLYTLRGILREAFPYHTAIPIGAHNFYYGEDGKWASTDRVPFNFETHSTKDFFKANGIPMSCVTEYNNGDKIDFCNDGVDWESGIFIGINSLNGHPFLQKYVVICNETEPYYLCFTDKIRHKEENKETILERIEEQIGLASVETDLNIRKDYLQQALIDIKKL